MKLMDIYYNAENPIMNDKKLYKIIESYGNPNGLYAGLTMASSRNYTVGDNPFGQLEANHNKKDKDEFYSKITNLWINNIKNMSREEFNSNIGTRSFYDLRHKYIMNLDEAHTKEESDRILNGLNQDTEIKEALNRYRWDYHNQKYWEHVKESKISAGINKLPKIDHRLYVNPDSEDLFEFMNYFVDKCSANDMRFYFKFCKDFTRDDSFVIYSSTEELSKYIDILQEIKKEHPDLVSRFKEPPILSGEIDNWIGYGSEPTLLNKDKVDYSFNSLREKEVLTPAIKETTRDWIKNNINKSINYKNKTITIKELVSCMAVDDIVKTLNHFIKGKSITQAVNENGICMYDLQDTRVLNDIYKIVNKHMEDNLLTYCDKGLNNVEKITLPLRNNKKFNFYPYQFERVLNDLPRRIVKNDKKYVEDLRNRIMVNADKYMINPNKFFLDNYALREFQLEDYNNLRKESFFKRIKDNHKNNELDEMFNNKIVEENKYTKK